MEKLEKARDKKQADEAQKIMELMKLPYHIKASNAATGYWDIKKGNTIICASLTGSECIAYVKGIEDVLTDIELGDYKLEEV